MLPGYLVPRLSRAHSSKGEQHLPKVQGVSYLSITNYLNISFLSNFAFIWIMKVLGIENDTEVQARQAVGHTYG